MRVVSVIVLAYLPHTNHRLALALLDADDEPHVAAERDRELACAVSSQLREDLRRAAIEPWAWAVNASLAAARPSGPLLARRARTELPEIERVTTELAARTALVPLLAEEPVGPRRLHVLFGSSERAEAAATESLG